MRADVASRAPHGRKHGATFAESWTAHDGTLFVAIGSVFAGRDPVAVGDLLKVGARTVLTGHAALAPALAGLDALVASHAREHRDDELAASLLLLALPPGGMQVEIAGAGPLVATILDGVGTAQHVRGRAGALGTGIEPDDVVERFGLRRDDLVVAATVPIPRGWWASGDRRAETLLARAGAPEASAAVVSL